MNRFMCRRYLLFCLSLFVNALGIAFITKAALGTSPITSVTYVLSMFTPFTIGQWTILLNLLFVILELFLMTREDLKSDLRMYLLQIPISFCFGMFIDLCMHYILFWLNPVEYVYMIVALLIGCVILAVGIALEVKANAAMMAGEYFVKVITRRFRGEFGYIKLGFDVTLVAIACLLSLVFMSGVYGVREGTVVSALVVGPIVHFVSPYYRFWINGLQMLLCGMYQISQRDSMWLLLLRVNMAVEDICWVKCFPKNWASSFMIKNSYVWQPSGAGWMNSIL